MVRRVDRGKHFRIPDEDESGICEDCLNYSIGLRIDDDGTLKCADCFVGNKCDELRTLILVSRKASILEAVTAAVTGFGVDYPLAAR